MEVTKPPSTATPIGARKALSTPNPNAIGNMPAPMANEVITMGRARLWQASMMASERLMP